MTKERRFGASIELSIVTFLGCAALIFFLVLLFEIIDRLHGTYKQQITGILALSIFGVCGVGGIYSGWQTGALLLISAFVFGACLFWPSVWIARRLTDYPDLGVEEYRRRRADEFRREVNSGRWLEKAANREKRDQILSAKCVDVSIGRTEVQQVLAKHGADRADLEAMYRRLEIQTLPAELRQLALSNARLVDWFFSNSVSANINGEYVRNLNGLDKSVRFALWASSNPCGDEPKSG